MMSSGKLLNVLNGQVETPPPVWLMRQAGRYLPEYKKLRQTCPNFMTFCLTPELTIEATQQPLRRYDFDAAILFSDILTIPYALGQKVDFVEGKGPQLPSIRSLEDIKKLSLEEVLIKLAPVFETVRGLRRVLPQDKALIGFAGAPWTIFAYMVEGQGSRSFSNAIQFLYHHPEAAQTLMDLICCATERYLDAQIQAGAQVLQLFDSWAGAVPFPLIDRAIYQPTRRLLTFLKHHHPAVPIICFPKGLGEKIPHYVKVTQASALGLDAHVDLSVVLPQLPPSLPVQGALDPQILIVGGDVLRQEVSRLVKCFAGRPHIFNLGHGITPETPPAHVDHLMALLKEKI